MPRPSNPSPSLPVHAMPRLIVHTCVLKFSSPSCYSYTLSFSRWSGRVSMWQCRNGVFPCESMKNKTKKKKLTIPSKPYHAQRKVCLSPHLSPMHLVPLGERPWFSSPILFGASRTACRFGGATWTQSSHPSIPAVFSSWKGTSLPISGRGGVYPSHSVKQGNCAPLGIC